MATEHLIYWRHADERGLKPVRTLDLRVEPDRDGRAFLIRELVEYDSGQQGWRFRTGEGPMGIERIAVELREKPYLRHILMFEGGYPQLYVSEDGLVWKEWGRNETYELKRRIAVRAMIADAFGMDPEDHCCGRRA